MFFVTGIVLLIFVPLIFLACYKWRKLTAKTTNYVVNGASQKVIADQKQKNVRRKISSTDYTIKYYPDPDDSSKRQKVVVEEETQDTELTTEELKMAFRLVGEETVV